MAEEFENQLGTDGEAYDEEFDNAFAEAAGESVPGPDDSAPDNQAQQESLQDIGQASISSDPEPEDVPDDDEGADYQHKYSSAMGRLKASQAQNKELADQIAQMREQLAAFQAGMQGSTQQEDAQDEVEVEGLEDVPEELHSLFKDDSADGKRLRRMLEEYGADYAIPIAETVKERRELQQFRAQAEQDRASRVEEDHFTRIANAVPEYADALIGQNRQAKFNELVQGVKAWIGTLPYSEGVAMDRVVNTGTPDEVISMLRSYSKYRNGGSGRSASAVRNLARSNMAVPASRSAPRSKQISKDDFDAAFDEFSRS